MAAQEIWTIYLLLDAASYAQLGAKREALEEQINKRLKPARHVPIGLRDIWPHNRAQSRPDCSRAASVLLQTLSRGRGSAKIGSVERGPYDE